MAKKFDYEGAKKEGYSDEEIKNFLLESYPDFKYDEAVEEGYSPDEINKYLSYEAPVKDISRARSLASAPVKGALKSAPFVNPMQMFSGPIKPEMAGRLLEEYLPTHEKAAEKVLERAGEIAPFVAGGPEGILQKGIQIGGGALAGYLAEKEGMGKVGQAISEMVGMSFPGLMKSLGLGLKNLITKGFSKPSGELLAKGAMIKPEEVNQVVQDAAQRLGVTKELPISAQVSNSKVQAIETRLMQSHSGKPIQQKLERLGGKLTEEFKEAGKTISSRENLLPSVVSEEALSALKNIESESESAYRSLYGQSEKLLPETAMSNDKIGKAIHKVIDSTMVKLNSSLGTPSKDALLKRLSRLKENWSATPELESGMIPIKDLIELKQDLNQVIKYELKGGVDKLLKPLFGVTKEAIQSYGREANKPFLTRFNQAEKIFSENANTFRKNHIIQSVVNSKNPEAIFSKMNTVKGINEMEKVFSKTPEGKEAFDALKKYKLEDLLNKKVMDKNGNISWGKAAGMFKDPKTRDLSIRLLGKAQYEKLKDLSKVASGVEEGFKKFLNTSKTATTAMDMALMVGLPIKAAQQLFSGNVLGAVRTTAAIFAPHQLAKLIANPEFVEAAIRTAKAGKGNDPGVFMKEALRVAQITSKEMTQNIQEDEEAI